MVTAAAVIVGGTLAYFNFLKGRTHPRCSIDMNCKLKELAGAPGLWVSVIVQNEGNAPLLIPYDVEQLLYVSQANAALWWLACERGHQIHWEESTIKPIRFALSIPEGEVLRALEAPDTSATRKPRLTISKYRYLFGERLEPGEQWERSTLIPVSPDSVAYLLRVRIIACRHVAPWHVVWHRLYCRPPRYSWIRDIHIFTEEHR